MSSRKIIILIITLCLIFLLVLFEIREYKTEEKGIEMAYYEPKKPISTKKLFNLNFEYEINSDACGDSTKNGSNILALILVTTYFGNVETRSAMRRAFPNNKLEEFHLKRVFLLGVAPEDKYTTQNAILHESQRFGDIIQGNFKEAYRNLTYKHVMGLKWASMNCKDAKYVIKMDDDIVVNLYKVVELLQTVDLPKKKLLAGYVLRGLTPIREPRNKWYVTKEEYGSSLYPTFISGWFYITNPSVCHQLVEASSQTQYFWVDDVYVTGLLAQKLRIKHYSFGELFTVHPEFLQCCMRDVTNLHYDCEVVVGPNGGDNNLFFNFNDVLAKCYYERCGKRTKALNQTCVAEKKYSLGRGKGSVETYRLS